MCISYVLLACYAVILTFTILNFVQFVCKSDQCCQVRHPLLTFYILIFCWICAEFFNNLFIATYTTPRASMTSLIFSHSFFKSMVGIEQIWLIVELSLRLTQMEGFERKQARGRFWVYAAHIFMLVAFIVVTCIMDVGVGTIDVMVGDDILAWIFSVLNVLLFFALVTSVSILIRVMNRDYINSGLTVADSGRS